MWPWISKEDKKIAKAVENIQSYLIAHLKDNGLISLLLAGTINAKKERTAISDIDFFGIVENGFDYTTEEAINKRLRELKTSLCLGYDCRLRCFDIEYLKGGKNKTFTHKYMLAPRLVQRMPFYKVVWGKKFDYHKEFVGPMKLEDEATHLMDIIMDDVRQIRMGSYASAMRNFPKQIIELARVEAQMFHGFKYHPGRYQLVRHLRKEKNHIVHKAWHFRNELHKKPSDDVQRDAVSLCTEAENYVFEFQCLLRKQKTEALSTSL
jgi:hypothetical protein